MIYTADDLHADVHVQKAISDRLEFEHRLRTALTSMASAGILQLNRPLEAATLLPAPLPPAAFPEGGVATFWSQIGSSSLEA